MEQTKNESATKSTWRDHLSFIEQSIVIGVAGILGVVTILLLIGRP